MQSFVDKHFWVVKIDWDGDTTSTFTLYQLSEIEDYQQVGYTFVRSLNLKTTSVDDGIQELIGTVPTHYFRFRSGPEEFRVYHNHDPISDFGKDVTYYKGFFYRVLSKCHLWRWHDLMYIEVWGHDFNTEEPEIFMVRDIDEVYRTSPEIEWKYENQPEFFKYDVLDPICVEVRNFAWLGIDVIEMNEDYHSGEFQKGLFIYSIDKSSNMYDAGFRIGDTITSVRRNKIDKSYRLLCIEDLTHAIEDIIEPDETLTFEYHRGDNGESGNRTSKIEFKEKKFEHVWKLEKVKKALFDIFLDVAWLKIRFTQKDEERMRNHLQIIGHVNEEMYLEMTIPEVLDPEMEFSLNEDGKLVLNYGRK